MLAESSTYLVPFIAAGGVGLVATASVILWRARKSAATTSTPVEQKSANTQVVGNVDAADVAAPITTEVAPHAELPNVRDRAGRTRSLFVNAFQSIRSRNVDASTWDELEETLLLADIGIGLATRLLDPLRQSVKDGDLRSGDEVIQALRTAMTAQLSSTDRALHLDAAETPNVWLFVGVNGVGKTTTIGKIATAEAARGTSVLMAAGDTFRAAAAEQLQVWAERSGASFVRGAEGGDPASVIFDGIQSAAAKGVTLVLGDTAGRLQNKSNLGG